jgi:hypothetical protein
MTLLSFTSEQATDFLTSVAAATDVTSEVFDAIISAEAIQVILDREDVAVDLTAFAACATCASAAAVSAALAAAAAGVPSAAESAAAAAVRALFLGSGGAALSLASVDAVMIDIFTAADTAAIAACYGGSGSATLHGCALARMATGAALKSIVLISFEEDISSAFTLTDATFNSLVGLTT